MVYLLLGPLQADVSQTVGYFIYIGLESRRCFSGGLYCLQHVNPQTALLSFFIYYVNLASLVIFRLIAFIFYTLEFGQSFKTDSSCLYGS